MDRKEYPLSEELVQKIQQVSPPSTKKQLRSFWGLVGYYRTFVPNFAAIAVSLTDLTKKRAPNILVWTEAQDQAFRVLKQCVCRPPVLRLPDVSKTLILQTDASCDGIGVILLQEEDQVKHPVAVMSNKLLSRERNYSNIERKALAMICGVQKFELFIGCAFLPGDRPSSSAVSSVSQISKWSSDEVVIDYATVSFHCPYN